MARDYEIKGPDAAVWGVEQTLHKDEIGPPAPGTFRGMPEVVNPDQDFAHIRLSVVLSAHGPAILTELAMKDLEALRAKVLDILDDYDYGLWWSTNGKVTIDVAIESAS